MNRNPLGLTLAAVALFGAGALAMYLFGSRSLPTASSPSGPANAASTAPAAADPATGPLVLQISPEMVTRAGIRVETVRSGAVGGGLRVPGTVQPNAYRRVGVTALAGGRVTRVPVELGQHVSRGATLAEIYSPDLAQARTQYLSMKADLEVEEARVARTERLARIGAASQQELEQARAEHTRHQTGLEQAATGLRLLGVDPARVTHAKGADLASATLRVPAPQAGVVLERPATVGMTVESSTVLVTLVDLSPVWVVADVFERDFSAVRTGTRAIVTTDAYPGLSLSGTVSYVSPEVRPETRTAEVRVELPNPAGRLRLGMFVNVTLEGVSRAGTAVIPRAAVQTVGTRDVVYVVLDQAAGRFEQRPVLLGGGDREHVSVTSGLTAGDRIVTAGSFSIRAEAERTGPRSPATPGASKAADPPPAAQTFAVSVTASGFEPNALTLAAGKPARITFTRTSDETCAKEVVFPDYGIRRALPLNQAVTVELIPKRDGTSGFVCGMNMLQGALVVR